MAEKTKLSFSIPSKSTKKNSRPSKIPHGEDDDVTQHQNQILSRDDKQFVTQYDPSKTLTPNSKTLIIPPKPNEWQPHKRMKNLDIPLSDSAVNNGELEFVVETLSANTDPQGTDKIGYGLNLRKNVEDFKVVDTEKLLLEKLKYDLQNLPEDRGFEEFEDVPVEGFGAALLKGYGWKEGMGIGRNVKEDVKVKQYHKRTDKQGLGFVESDMNRSRKKVRREDSYDKKEKKRDRDEGRGRSEDGFFLGKEVRVIAGSGDVMGVKGTIIERLESDSVLLKVAKTGKEIKVRVSDIAELGSREEEKCLRKMKELSIGNGEESNNKVESGKRGSNRGKEKNASSNAGDLEIDRKRRVSWLRSHIRVRIISKDLKGGKLYLKKGQVVDVVGPYVCDVSMDESKELVQGVEQDLLETALPRRGGPVLVLSGKHKGAYGNLVQKDLDRETGVVQDADSQELLNVKLEQIAEYLGDPSYLGY